MYYSERKCKNHRAGWYRPGGYPFLSPCCWSCAYGSIYDAGTGPYHPRVRRDLAIAPVGNYRRALVPRASANHELASRVGVFTPCEPMSTWGMPVVVLVLLEL